MNMIIDFKQMSQRIKAGSDNLYLIYGEEGFFIDLARSEMKKTYLAKGFEQMDYCKLDFNGKSVDTDIITESIELPPWASSKRLVEVVNFGFDQAATEKLPEILEHIPESTVLVFAADKIDKRKKKLYDAFVKNGVVCEVKQLEENNLIEYINKNFRKSNLTIDPDACESLISRYNSSLRMIISAMRRIILYSSAVGKTNVDYDTVEQLCEPDVHANIFKIMDAIGEGRADAALVHLDNLIKLKEPLPQIRFMIARHFRELICAKELGNKGDLVKRIGVRDFVARNLINQSRNFTMGRLLFLYNLCYKNDFDLKHGEVDERASLESFIVLASVK